MPFFNLILISIMLMIITITALGIKLLVNRNIKIELQGCYNTNGDSSCNCINARSCEADKVNQPTA